MKHKCRVFLFLFYFYTETTYYAVEGIWCLAKGLNGSLPDGTDSCKIHEEMMKEVIILAVVQHPKLYTTYSTLILLGYMYTVK